MNHYYPPDYYSTNAINGASPELLVMAGQGRQARLTGVQRIARECFLKAAELSLPPIEPVRIEYEDTFLPGYFVKADEFYEKRPVHGGFDSTAEELYFIAVSAVRRGYNCITFDGPGQGAALREQNLSFSPDWEKVITPVIDYLYTRSDVDTGRIALIGYSLVLADILRQGPRLLKCVSQRVSRMEAFTVILMRVCEAILPGNESVDTLKNNVYTEREFFSEVRACR